MRRSVVELVVDLSSKDLEDVGFDGQFGNCVWVRFGCLKEERRRRRRRRVKKGSLSVQIKMSSTGFVGWDCRVCWCCSSDRWSFLDIYGLGFAGDLVLAFAWNFAFWNFFEVWCSFFDVHVLWFWVCFLILGLMSLLGLFLSLMFMFLIFLFN